MVGVSFALVGLLLAAQIVLRVREAMSLLDALLEPVATKTLLCKVGRRIDELEEPYKSALAALVANEAISDQSLSQKLHDAGIPVSTSVVYLHRRAKCSCGRVVVE